MSLLRLFRNGKTRGERLAMISVHDAPGAALCCDAGADVILVGDSLGNVVLGYESPLLVSMEDMLRHTAAVARGVGKSLRPQVPIIADLPFGGYTSAELAVANGAELVRAGAHGVKLEGAGVRSLEAVRALVEMGAPVVGHIGFTPQAALQFESIVQGRTAEAAAQLVEEASSLEEAGCCAVVLEAVTVEVARHITETLSVSTVGIGAGLDCDAQVLVWHDLIGLTQESPLRFVRHYADARALLEEATGRFVEEVHSGAFPEPEHGWTMDESELRGWTPRGKDG